ncbi:MAG: hypothetical protein ACI9JN_000320 [Bacteroidia bacterium]|jgi:hypothetical protein
MTKNLLFLVLIGCLSCEADRSVILNHVTLKIYPYEHEGEMRASAMPAIKPDSELIMYKRRFEYLLINESEIHLPEKSEQRNGIWKLYPDTSKLKRLYLNKFVQDGNLVKYFEETIAPIKYPNMVINKTFTEDELMEVASKFFYCDKVNADTSVQAHVCVGLNGVSEADWEIDYTLLEAFCYEGIFNDFDKENAQIWESFVSKKMKASLQFKKDITTLDQYLENVKLDLFERMRNDKILKNELLHFYELNEANLSFKINK